ncbi:MAG: 2-amino-4-hydroxy-6-hydroxymethyldihydropteridine diphosphokinase [Bryobacterales bacterium]|nr:2-amino-4-hydroxy-6-hydroxymethyldihydropteridine diphosphokinase [Bryobacterales bacterium]
MSGKILLRGVRLACHVGVPLEERARPQELIADAEMDFDTRPAARSDGVDDTVDYARVLGAMRQVADERSYALIETLAEAMAEAILRGFPVERLRLLVRKPRALEHLGVDWPGVEIVRERSAGSALADVYLALGSNAGDPRTNLCAALTAVGRECEVAAVSSLWRTEPVGYLDQPWFLNAAALIRTARRPHEMLSFLQGIEAAMGRERVIPNGPRTIDLDILLWGDEVVHTGTLRVPHPRMRERLFVLAPLAEIAPALVVPGLDGTVEELRAAAAGTMRIEWAGAAPW